MSMTRPTPTPTPCAHSEPADLLLESRDSRDDHGANRSWPHFGLHRRTRLHLVQALFVSHRNRRPQMDDPARNAADALVLHTCRSQRRPSRPADLIQQIEAPRGPFGTAQKARHQPSRTPARQPVPRTGSLRRLNLRKSSSEGDDALASGGAGDCDRTDPYESAIRGDLVLVDDPTATGLDIKEVAIARG